MSTIEQLSLASNVLQIVGFADTVFRAGKVLYELFDKARSVSKTIALLLLELQALLSVVAFVHVVIAEYASSPFAQDDGHTMPNVHTILTLIEQDFRHLKGLLSESERSGREGWLSLFHYNVRWALRDEEIMASRHRLARYTQNLNAALSVSGRRNDIVLRTKLQHIEDRLVAISQSNLSQQLILKSTESSSKPPKFKFPNRQASVAGVQLHPRIRPRKRLPRSQSNSSPLDHPITPGIVLFNGSQSTHFNHSSPKYSVYERVDDSLFLDCGNFSLHEITKPAILLRDTLMESLGMISNNLFVGFSELQRKHLLMLFDFLVASAHVVSAETITASYGNSASSAMFERGLLDGEFKYIKTHKRLTNSKTVANSFVPTFLNERCTTLNTPVSSVKAQILSAWSSSHSKTLAFTFQYFGNGTLDLSPFAVDFKSHQLQGCFQCDPSEICDRCSMQSRRLEDNYRLSFSSIKFSGITQEFIRVLAMPYEESHVVHFVGACIHHWMSEEITIYVTCGSRLPRIPVKVYEFMPSTSNHLEQIEYRRDPLTQLMTCVVKQSPPLGMMHISYHEEKRYSKYIDDIVENYLDVFGETCWLEEDNGFQTVLFRLMASLRPRHADEVDLLRDVYRLLVSTFIMGHIITIAEENKHRAFSGMQADQGNFPSFCSPRVTNRQLKMVFQRLQASIFTTVLSRLQRIFKTSNGCEKWVYAFIAILGLAMAIEDQQKSIQCVGLAYYSRIGARNNANIACCNLDEEFGSLTHLFRLRFIRKVNPLRDAHLEWEGQTGFKDQQTVNFVRCVAKLVKNNVDFLTARQKVTVSSENLTQFTSRLVAQFLISFWLPS